MSEIVTAVSKRVDHALKKNEKLELVLVGVLVILFFCGVGLLTVAFVRGEWSWSVGAGLFESAIILPINQLRKLRRDNLLLQTFPHLIQLTDSGKAQALVVDFVQRLIQQV